MGQFRHLLQQPSKRLWSEGSGEWSSWGLCESQNLRVCDWKGLKGVQVVRVVRVEVEGVGLDFPENQMRP